MGSCVSMCVCSLDLQGSRFLLVNVKTLCVKRLEGVARYSWDVRICSWIFGSVTFCIAYVIAIIAA